MHIFSTVNETVLLDENFKVKEKIELSGDKSKEAAYNLSVGKEIKSETSLKQSHKSAKKAVDAKNIYKALTALNNITPGNLREINIFNTKKLISESVNYDGLIIQAVKTIEDLDKNANGLCKRLREWYSLYMPEASENISDNEAFVRVILKKDKKTLMSELNISMSMGSEGLKDEDISIILSLAKNIQQLYDQRKKQEEYIEAVMKKECPNFLALAGANIGAKMIAQAGSFRRMVMMPASTIQLLGAEEALFRHIKTGSRPPKYGILFQHPYVIKAKKADKGKIAKTIADKISIALKVDFFKGEYVGDKLKDEVEEKIKSKM